MGHPEVVVMKGMLRRCAPQHDKKGELRSPAAGEAPGPTKTGQWFRRL